MLTSRAMLSATMAALTPSALRFRQALLVGLRGSQARLHATLTATMAALLVELRGGMTC